MKHGASSSGFVRSEVSSTAVHELVETYNNSPVLWNISHQRKGQAMPSLRARPRAEIFVNQLYYLGQSDILMTHPWRTNVMKQVGLFLSNEQDSQTGDDAFRRSGVVRPKQVNVSQINYIVTNFTEAGMLVVVPWARTFTAAKSCMTFSKHPCFIACKIDSVCFNASVLDVVKLVQDRFSTAYQISQEVWKWWKRHRGIWLFLMRLTRERKDIVWFTCWDYPLRKRFPSTFCNSCKKRVKTQGCMRWLSSICNDVVSKVAWEILLLGHGYAAYSRLYSSWCDAKIWLIEHRPWQAECVCSSEILSQKLLWAFFKSVLFTIA